VARKIKSLENKLDK